jgi:hypothetical protein
MENANCSNAWHTISVSNCPIEVSQSNPVLPKGLEASTEFITQEEADNLVRFFDQNASLWAYRGFAKRIREQRYSLTTKADESSPAGEFQWIVEKLMRCIGENHQPPDELIVEEQYPTAFVKGEKSGRLSSNVFEIQDQSQAQCSCYVAQITLLDKCIQSIDRPKERKIDCWDVESFNHNFKFIMEPRTLFMKSGETLWNWRSRVITFPTSAEKNAPDDRKRVITIKFKRTINHDDNAVLSPQEEKKEGDKEAFLSAMESDYNKPLDELMTIIVTTSPIKSNPSTEVLEKTFETFHHGGKAFLQCPKIIVCDGCRISNNEDGSKKATTKKYANAKQALRNGIATNDQAEKYEQFKVALTKICVDSFEDISSPFYNSR